MATGGLPSQSPPPAPPPPTLGEYERAIAPSYKLGLLSTVFIVTIMLLAALYVLTLYWGQTTLAADLIVMMELVIGITFGAIASATVHTARS
ncbi:MAG: hypothetical protein L3K16_08495 [Thermoplasmata archaeon]|nr:hypothetical protein [Thermoplasmata archaeon]